MYRKGSSKATVECHRMPVAVTVAKFVVTREEAL